jgi:hypothetical protein
MEDGGARKRFKKVYKSFSSGLLLCPRAPAPSVMSPSLFFVCFLTVPRYMEEALEAA